MNVLKYAFFALALLFWSSCKKNTPAETTDNLFAFKAYVSYHTMGQHSIAEPITVGLTNPLSQYDLTQEIPAEYIKIRPKVKGKLVIENGNTLLFTPEELLQPDTEYNVTIALDKLYEDVPAKYKNYTFAFKTLTPNFNINLDHLQSYSKEWQYLTGTLQASDLLPTEKISEILKVWHDGKSVKIKWSNTEPYSKYYNFTIDSIQRKTEDSELAITYDGAAVGVDQKGNQNYPVPGKNNFTIVDVKTSTAPNAYVTLNFSEALQENQDLKGFVRISEADELRYEVEGNLLHVYPSNRILGEVMVTVFSGIKSAYGVALKDHFGQKVSFEQLKPQVRLLSKGTILPNSTATPLYFETVNLKAIEVRVIQIFQNNMLQHLQYNNLTDNYNNELKAVGRRVAYKVIDLTKDGQKDLSYWKAHALDLSKLMQVDPGAMYRVEFSFRKVHALYTCEGSETETELDEIAMENPTENAEEQYWDNQLYRWRSYHYNWEEMENPCHEAYYNFDRVASINLLGSDLGLIVKKGTNKSYHFATSNLLTAQPEGNTKISLYNFQQQKLTEITTDTNGLGVYDGDATIAFAVAQKENNYAYAKLLDGNALSLSKFDVSGASLKKGLQGFLYTERGVHRPGDVVHLTFALDDKSNPLPQDHPVVLEVTDARGKLVQRNVLKDLIVAVNDSLFARKEGQFYYFPIPTTEDAPTGSWTATVKVGGATFNKTLRIATVKPNRLKIDLGFNKEVLEANRLVAGNLQVNWLHGAPARNLKVDINAKISVANTAFPNYKKYNFKDPVRSFTNTELQLLEDYVDDNGLLAIQKEISVNKNAPGMLQATFTTLAYEQGGDYSLDVFTKPLAPYRYFVGLQSPEPKQYGSFYTDEKTTFDVISVDAQGKAAAQRKLTVKVYEIAWRWWWNRGNDNLSRYDNASVHIPYKELSITTDAQGKGSFSLSIPENDRGRFLIRVIDEASGHATGRTAYFYRNWWNRAHNGDAESSKILLFASDKESYETGEEATISFPSSAGGKALVSIENGSEVLSQQWISTKDKETKTSIKITPEMAPNVYVNISLLQPHGQVRNDMPVRLYGVMPLLVTNPATELAPKIDVPEVLKPEENYTITVSEAHNNPMTYSIAVVDQGLLDLTRFKTPDIHAHFYARKALGVKTFDIYDAVMGAYSISVDNIIGGGGMAEGAKNRKAQRFKPVVTYLGPFTLKAGSKDKHTIKMPNYVGAVRAMVVAGNAKGAYGHTEKSVPVRKPLMVLSSVPRKLTPGETVTIPVTVFAMEKKVKNVEVTIKTSEALEPLGNTTKNLNFKGIGDQVVNFDFKVKPNVAYQTIEVTASGAGEKATTKTEIQISNPNPITTNSTLHTLEANEKKSFDFTVFGTSGSNNATVEFSTLPPMDFSKRLAYLIAYPHGCVEQTTSAAFPQLFLSSILDIDYNQQKSTEKNIKAAIKKLSDFQTTDGGLSYWPGNSYADEWGTNYAGHFMLEAKSRGYQLPLTFLSNWLRYQTKTAREWNGARYSYNTDLTQAYRLYTLALAQQPELAAMNRLREQSNLSNNAKWRLAAAYALIGKKSIAQELINKANIEITPKREDYHTYGSVFRNRAMALETLVLLGSDKQRELALSLAKNLSSDKWYSTQETAYALLAMAKMAKKNGGKAIDLSYIYNGKEYNVKSDKALAIRDLPIRKTTATVTVNNKRNNVVYATLNLQGRLPVGQELEQQQKVVLKTSYINSDGSSLSVDQLRQGTEFQARISVTNTTNDDMDNLALTQLLPSGWELVDTSFVDNNNNSQGVDYQDTRDDRTHFYFGLKAKSSKSFVVRLNASYLGTYYLPGSQVEAMYDNTISARTKGTWVKVVQ
ncbi:alpha-2-macroglobulin family protein [Croceivirga sp. JEA036]|uniref:alpha-2-macroglobulin family protein n=1 Tax=Croceivirga sp. JEA036 TaxID=2721162 RepID=UPI00143BC2EE|nr:MG2 domain-containing protein [Croceivirga sp. JEA036]NJB37827.1 hypothetical protein [Croceivirga sp. JEA036]